MKTRAFCIYQWTEVIVVGKDKDLVFATFQVVLLSLKNLNNGQELWIVSLITGFGNYLLKEKNYRVPLANFGLRKK